MERYRFEIRFRLAGELKQSYTYIEMVRWLGNSGLKEILLERAGFLGYKDTAVDIPLPADMVGEEAEIIGHEVIDRLREALGGDPRHFSGTLVLSGTGKANEEDAEKARQVLAEQGFAVFLEPASAF
jgi:hypothetical protein